MKIPSEPLTERKGSSALERSRSPAYTCQVQLYLSFHFSPLRLDDLSLAEPFRCVRITSDSRTHGSERNNRIGAPVDHAFDPTCSFFFVPHRTLDHRHTQDNCERIALPLTFTASRLPFSTYIPSRSLRTLGDDDQRLAGAARHRYAFNTFLSPFSPSLLTFS